MMKLDDALAGVTALGFDTSPIIYFVEEHPRYDAIVTALHPVTGWLSDGLVLKVPKGGIGRKMQQVKRWLLRRADSRR